MAVEHKDITGAENHEPKGIESAVSGTVYVANGAGSGSWTNPADITGLGTIASQDAGAVTITGGEITGITDLALSDGGTGASTASDARTNLGLGTLATQAASAVSITGGSVSGVTDVYTDRTRATVNALATLALNCTKSAYTKTITTNSTFTFSNVPAGLFTLVLKLVLSAGAVPTFPAEVTWPDGVVPTWANGTWYIVFVTVDSGASWATTARSFS